MPHELDHGPDGGSPRGEWGSNGGVSRSHYWYGGGIILSLHLIKGSHALLKGGAPGLLLELVAVPVGAES